MLAVQFERIAFAFGGECELIISVESASSFVSIATQLSRLAVQREMLVSVGRLFKVGEELGTPLNVQAVARIFHQL
ncbi:hypothetical protein D3C72_2283050 [compost metagenome]